MHSYTHIESSSGISVTIDIGEENEAGDEFDHYREVTLLLDDGRKYFTVFFPDPQQRGKHWFEDPHMSIVNDLSIENIMAATNDFLDAGQLEDAFEQID